MSDQFFYLQLKFTPEIAHTFTDERRMVVEVPKGLVKRKSKLINESLRDEDSPIWCHKRPTVMNERPCDHEEDGTRAWKIL
jgi:hypothetical protein